MPRSKGEYIGVTQYSCVYEMRAISVASDSRQYFQAKKKINGKMFRVLGQTAKGAAMALDIKLIESGSDPINVLKRK